MAIIIAKDKINPKPSWAILPLVGVRAAVGFEVTDGVLNARGRIADALNLHTTKNNSINSYTNHWAQAKKISELTGASIGEVIQAMQGHYNIIDKNFGYTQEQYKQQIVIINDTKSPVIALALQNKPPTIRVDQNTSWAQVRSAGMNNPFQIYTGSEDTISFEISWYATDLRDRSDVITKCRLLESWSKADGYQSAPPVLKLVWGDSDLFGSDLFILSNASYQLSNFQQAIKDPQSKTNINLGLYPNVAIQQIVLKKVSLENQKHSDIVSDVDLRKTSGIRHY